MICQKWQALVKRLPLSQRAQWQVSLISASLIESLAMLKGEPVSLLDRYVQETRLLMVRRIGGDHAPS